MHALWHDLRNGIRSLAKSPGLATLAVLALALGIGANTAIFSVVNGVLLRPLPYANPSRLVVVLHGGNSPVSPADFLDWRKQATSFEQLGAAQGWGGTLTGTDRAEHLRGLQVTANLFQLLGVSPIYGRSFESGEDQPDRGHVAMLGHALWQRRFGGDPAIVGQQLTLDGESYTVIGIMPESFHFAPFWITNSELWVPLVLDHRANDRDGRSLRIFARLRDGVSLRQAQSEIDVICSRLAQQYPATNTKITAQVVLLQEKVVANIRPTLLVLLGTVGFVLLIACSNVANLMLVRANGKSKETAVRLALGSGKWRLMQQFMLESLALSLAGAAAGFWMAGWGIRVLVASLPKGSLPRLEEVGVDNTVLLFTVVLAVATGIFCGLAPAFRAFRTDLQESLRSGGRGSTSGRGENRTRAVLVMSEVALALVLLMGAGLTIRTFQHLQAVEPGFNPHNLLSFEVAAGGQSYPTGDGRIRFFEQLRPRLEALPGVESVSLINHLPISGDIWKLGISVEGRPTPPPGMGNSAAYRVVQPGYFQTMKTPFMRGRDFNSHDVAGTTPVVIINEALSKHHWPGADPVGQRVLYQSALRTVVGVVRNLKQTDWTANPDDEIYLPHAQSSAVQFSYMTVVLRAQGDPLLLAKSAADVVRSLDKDVPIGGVQTMEQVIADKLWRGRLAMTLLGLFAGVAVILAALGIYGVMSYSVAQRTSEIGIRMALGASATGVLGMILRQGLAVVGSGLLIGLAGAWGLTRTLASLLYGVTATDPVTFVAVPLLLLVLSTAACCFPAWRAAKTDPLTSLRHE